MWFNDDQTAKKKGGFRKGHSAGRRKPILMVNARLRNQRGDWPARVGVVILVSVALGATIALGWLGVSKTGDVLLARNGEFEVTNVVISCENPAIRCYVEGELRRQVGTNLFQTDISRIQAKLARAVSIKSVTVSRRLPDTLVVSVCERTPIARFGAFPDASGCLAIDDEGVVFPVEQSRAAILPAISGWGEKKPAAGDKLTGPIQDALFLLNFCCVSDVGQMFRIDAVDIKRDFLVMRLVDGPDVSLAWDRGAADKAARSADLGRRLDTLVAHMRKYERAGVTLHTIDLTFPNYAEYCPTTPRLDTRN